MNPRDVAGNTEETEEMHENEIIGGSLLRDGGGDLCFIVHKNDMIEDPFGMMVAESHVLLCARK